MKNAKSILILLTILGGLFMLVGCGDSKEPGNEETPSVTEPVETPEPTISDGGRAPIYQGMTISSAPITNQTSSKDQLLSNKLNQLYEISKEDIEDSIKDYIEIIPSEEIDYFSPRNQDILITVKLFNPDGQSILRFILNGVTYQSFQFQEGSDSNNLILKVNSGNVSGIKEFTINEIKYVENNTNLIKDAIFEGNRTIKLGVEYSNIPMSNISNINITAASFSLNVNITDIDNLIEKSSDILKVAIFDGENIIQMSDLTIGDNEIRFEKLKINHLYQYAIFTVIDQLDGLGNHVHLMHQAYIQTEEIIEITNISPTQSSIQFDLIINDIDEVGTITAIELSQEETLIESLTDFTIREFTDLLSNNEYQIKVTYTYDLNDGAGVQALVISQTIITIAKDTPIVAIENIVSTQESIGFTITAIDVDQVGTVFTIELYQGETLVEILNNLSLREFTGLLSNNEYTIKLTYTYDLNDGVDSQVLVISQATTTTAKATPEVIIENILTTQTSVSFGITVTDVDQVGAVSAIELYKGETFIEALTDLAVREFTDLLTNNEYQIKLTYTYDLNDGVLDQELIIIKTVTTLQKSTPVVSVYDVETTQDIITFDVNVIDIDEVGTITAIELYQDETLIDSLLDVTTREFTDLLSNNEYQIKVTYTYDLNDGSMNQDLVIVQHISTLPKQTPSVQILNFSNPNLLRNSDFSEGVTNWSEVENGFHQGNGNLTLSIEENILKADIIAGDGFWEPRFGQQSIPFQIGKTYEVSFRAKSLVEKTIDIHIGELVNVSPWFIDFKVNQKENALITTEWQTFTIIFDMVIDNPRGGIIFNLGNINGKVNTTIWFDDIQVKQLSPVAEGYDYIEASVEIEDVDQVGMLSAIKLFKGDELIELKVDFTDKKFTGLLSNTEYRIEVFYIYNLNDGFGERTLITTKTVSTLAKATPEVIVDNIVTIQDSVAFDITVTDTDEVGEITAIELYKGETLIETLIDLSVREFTGLLSNNEYTIKVTYTFDLNDGLGAQTLVISQAATTVAKAIPIVTINNVNATFSNISFNLETYEEDTTYLTFETIYLSIGEVRVAYLDISLREFSGLLSNTEYIITVGYSYYLNDGKGVINEFEEYTIKTGIKTTPVIVVDNVVPSQDSISFDISVSDTDEVGAVSAIELYQGEALVQALIDLTIREFTGLLSNNDYSIKVTYTYDLNDGMGERNLVVYGMMEEIPQDIYTVTELLANYTENGTVYGTIFYAGYGPTPGDPITVGITDGNNSFYVKIWGTPDDFPTGLMLIIDYVYDVLRLETFSYDFSWLPLTTILTTVAKATPTVVIDNFVPTQTTIGFGITVTDVDQVGAVSAIELYKGESLVEALTDLSVREFTGLLSNNEYTIKVTYTYDLNDGIGSQTPTVNQVAKTIAKSAPTVSMDNIKPYISGIRYSINLEDTDEILSYFSIKLFLGDVLKEESYDIDKIVFLSITGNTNYDVFITYEYDLNDGNGVHQIIISYSILTLLYDGMGTEEDPFKVYNTNDLVNIKYYLSSNFLLMQNTNLSGIEWIPIGDMSNPFEGIFDGQGYVISGLTLTQSHDYVGLFGYNEGIVKNISLSEVSINVTGNINQLIYAGAFVGLNIGELDNLHIFSGSISVKVRSGVDGYLGGVVGYNDSYSELSNISNNASILGDLTTYTGGLVGYSRASFNIANSFNTGYVESNLNNVGGILGKGNSTIDISSSYNAGIIVGVDHVGGLVGNTRSTLSIQNSYNTGNVIASEQNIGGLIGRTYGFSDIYGSYNLGDVSGTYSLGGLIGSSIEIINLVDSYNSGNISGIQTIGGLIGMAYSNTSIISSNNYGIIDGTGNAIGGLLGHAHYYSTDIKNSSNTGDVSGNNNIGGLVGEISVYSITTIENSFNEGNISGLINVGGFIGHAEYSTNILFSYNSGKISGGYYIGGFVGVTTDIYVYYSMNFGDVISSNDTIEIGGIFGSTSVESSDFEGVYYTGLILASGVEIDGVSFGLKGTDLTIITYDFFTITIGWDPNIWDFTDLDVVNGIYPKLIIVNGQ